ncbi:hypothetical protein XH96_03410 [Bradyrhizobium sp. CCBAU 51765]|nr:hypothetical protein XH96_03410 [Bradyrhizobium sp. CCBAU 51765]
MLLRVNFFSSVGWRLPDAVRVVAIVALLVLGRTGTKPLLRMRRKHWRPGGKDVMVITSRGVLRIVPVVPALAAAVERYLDQAPDKRPGAPLLQTTSGKPQTNGFFGRTFSQIDSHLGFARSSKTMLRRFCSDMLRRGDDLDPRLQAALEYFEVGSSEIRPAHAPIAGMLALIRRRDPFEAGLQRAIGNDGFALQLAKKLDTSLPDRLTTQPSRKGCPRYPRLPADHWLVVWLKAHDFPRGKPHRFARAEELLDQRRDEILELLDRKELCKTQLRELLHVSPTGINMLIARAGMTAEERAAHRAEATSARQLRNRRKSGKGARRRSSSAANRTLRATAATKTTSETADRIGARAAPEPFR